MEWNNLNSFWECTLISHIYVKNLCSPEQFYFIIKPYIMAYLSIIGVG